MVDIETTGGNYFQDRIIEIAIIVTDGQAILSEYQTLINPERPILPFISKLTGISNSMVKNAPAFRDVASKIFEMLRGHIFVAHNVRFDYSFLKASFKSNHIRYLSPHLCTVDLSREVFPGLPSYSLGKLCKSLGVAVSNRHRAYGDTEATTVLFRKIWEINPQHVLSAIRTDEIVPENFPEGFNIDDLDEVSETNGVYTFYNELQKPVYVSKTKNLRNGILSHFRAPLKSQTNKWANIVRSFHIQEMPTDLSALIYETQEILKYKPQFNKFIRINKQRYGLYLVADTNGYAELKISEVSKIEHPPLLKFNSTGKATKYIQQIHTKLQLTPAHKQRLTPEKYNELLKSSIQYITYPYQNCWVIETKAYQEYSVVYIVQHYELKGYCLLKDFKHADYEEVHNKMQEVNETSEIRRGLLQLIRQKKAHLEIIDLGSSL